VWCFIFRGSESCHSLAHTRRCHQVGATRGLFNHFDHFAWSSQFPWPHAPSTLFLLPSSQPILPSFSYTSFARACPHSSHLQPSLPWIIPASAPLVHVDHPIPNIPNNLCHQILPPPTSINPHRLILDTVVLLILMMATTTTMSLFKLLKEETGEPRSISLAEYDNTLPIRISCHQPVPTPKLVSQWPMLRL